jgi:hypothetical protein
MVLQELMAPGLYKFIQALVRLRSGQLAYSITISADTNQASRNDGA